VAVRAREARRPFRQCLRASAVCIGAGVEQGRNLCTKPCTKIVIVE
jgi:hypothetical protein